MYFLSNFFSLGIFLSIVRKTQWIFHKNISKKFKNSPSTNFRRNYLKTFVSGYILSIIVKEETLNFKRDIG